MTPTLYLAPEQVYPQTICTTLRTIRKHLETLPEFPHDYCDLATEIVHHQIGLGMMGGHYLRCFPHYWNYDPQKKLYIDITRDQFEPDAQKISIFKSTQGDYHPNQNMTEEINRLHKTPLYKDILPTIEESLTRVLL